MKRKWNSYIMILITLAGLYAALLIVLVRSESTNPDSSIRTLGDAFWYSLATLTTVGYGDVSPVTGTGRFIGFVFLIMSTGLLVTFLGAFTSFFAGEGLPVIKLMLCREKNWYYFNDAGKEAKTLADKIVQDDEDAVIIFGCGEGVYEERPEYKCIFLSAAPERVFALKNGEGSKCKFFLMRENDVENNFRAVNISSMHVSVYARTSSGQDSLPGDIHFFHSYDCCARSYWGENPLTSKEKSIVIIGFGNYGKAIIERAILTNIIAPKSNVIYHVFGDGQEFIDVHTELPMTFSINKKSDDMDCIMFYSEPWSRRHDIIRNADRIIICDDNEQKVWDIYWLIRRCYTVQGRIDVRSSKAVSGISYFGTDDSIYTPEQILHTRLNYIAVAMNEVYRRNHPDIAKSWEELDDSLRQSKIAAADHLRMKVRILMNRENMSHLMLEDVARAYLKYRANYNNIEFRERMRRIEHLRWLRFYSYYNWSYGEVHDKEKRQDPRMQPYDCLTEEEREHCDYAWELMGEITFRDDD